MLLTHFNHLPNGRTTFPQHFDSHPVWNLSYGQKAKRLSHHQSQPFSQSYRSKLPTSLNYILPVDQRLLTLKTGCGYLYVHLWKSSKSTQVLSTSPPIFQGPQRWFHSTTNPQKGSFRCIHQTNKNAQCRSIPSLTHLSIQHNSMSKSTKTPQRYFCEMLNADENCIQINS